MRKKDYKLLCDAFPNYQYGEGIFAALADLLDENAPEYLDDVATLDLDYFALYSGGKRPSALVFDYMLGNDGGRLLFRVDSGGRLLTMLNQEFWVKSLGDNTALTSEQREKLAKIIWGQFGDKWNRLYDVIMAEYAPLENYNMTEEETPELTSTTTRASKIVTSGTSSGTGGIFAFNTTGDDPIPQSASETSGESTTSGLAKDNIDTTSNTGSRTLTRTGNIGVTTSQQMAQSEIDLRQYNFRKQMYDDIDTVLTLPNW